MQKLDIGAALTALKKIANPAFFLAPAMLPLLIVAVVAGVIEAMAGPRRGSVGAGLVVALLSIIVLVLVFQAIVHVHRYMLRDEPPDASIKGLPLSYFLAALGIWLPFMLAVITPFAGVMAATGSRAANGAFHMPAYGTALVVLIIIAALVAAFMVVIPMTLALPARALGNKDFTYTQAREAARGNRVGLALFMIVAGLIEVLIAIALGLVAAIFIALLGSTIGVAAAGIVGGLIRYVDVLVGAAALSVAYAALVERDPYFLRPETV
jgi:hypothetical protein